MQRKDSRGRHSKHCPKCKRTPEERRSSTSDSMPEVWELLPATFLQGQQRSLDIAFCDGEPGKYYAWNNDNYNAINEFYAYPKHLNHGLGRRFLHHLAQRDGSFKPSPFAVPHRSTVGVPPIESAWNSSVDTTLRRGCCHVVRGRLNRFGSSVVQSCDLSCASSS